jgi:hypothetical protein
LTAWSTENKKRPELTLPSLWNRAGEECREGFYSNILRFVLFFGICLDGFFEHKKTPVSLGIQGFFLMVEEGGFEPPKRNATDLQSAPFGHSGTPPYSICRDMSSSRLAHKMELVDGLEPPTC